MPYRKKRKKRPIQRDGKELLKADVNGQLYGKITKLLGSCHFEVLCTDEKTRRCKIRGSIRKRCRIKLEDFVIVALREFDDTTGDIIHKYSSDEVRSLQKEKEIPSNNEFDVKSEDENNDVEIDFNIEEI